MTRAFPTIAILAIAAVLAVAGCGGGSDSSSNEGGAYGSGGETSTASSGGSSTAAKTGSNGSATPEETVVAVAENPKAGKILVNGKGFTLYVFHKDKGGKSACYGACASIWPPLAATNGKASAVTGAGQVKIGILKRRDGISQVTYAGKPLYTYTADTKPGMVKGNDFSSYGGEWYALRPSGLDTGE